MKKIVIIGLSLILAWVLWPSLRWPRDRDLAAGLEWGPDTAPQEISSPT